MIGPKVGVGAESLQAQSRCQPASWCHDVEQQRIKELEREVRGLNEAGEILKRPRHDRVIHHSDAGSEYASTAFAETLVLEGIAASIGSIGDAYDNGLAETTIGLFKTEAVGRHSRLNHIPSDEYEAAHCG